jgi:hypothetical protein
MKRNIHYKYLFLQLSMPDVGIFNRGSAFIDKTLGMPKPAKFM